MNTVYRVQVAKSINGNIQPGLRVLKVADQVRKFTFLFSGVTYLIDGLQTPFLLHNFQRQNVS